MAVLCRLCLSESDKFTDVSIIQEGLPLSVIIMIICPVKIETCDILPKQICDQCLEIVVNAYKLREVSNTTERYLRGCHDDIQIIGPEENEKLSAGKSPQVQESSAEDLEVYSSDFPETNEMDITIALEDSNDGKNEEGSHSKEDYVVYASEEENTMGYTEVHLQHDLDFKYKVDCQNVNTKKSAVWNFFGYLIDENERIVAAERDSYFCKICVEQLQTLKPKYKIESTATSVLFSHLSRVHNLLKSDMSENLALNTTQTVPELVTCDVCEKAFNSNSLSIHMGIEHLNGTMSRKEEINPQYRVNCFKSSSKSLAWDYFGALENHDGDQLDEYYFYCRLCIDEDGKLNPKYTKNTSTSILLQHLKNAHIPKTPEELSKKKLPEPIVMNTNKRLKYDEFVCKICGEGLESKKSLNRHLAKSHNEEQPRDYACPFENCGKTFTMRDTLLKHNKNIHQGTKFPCDRCPTILSTRMSLRRHIESCHLKIKLYSCDNCGAKYTEQKTLKNHIQKVHLGIIDKKISCDHCILMFPNQWSLKRHSMLFPQIVYLLIS